MKFLLGVVLLLSSSFAFGFEDEVDVFGGHHPVCKIDFEVTTSKSFPHQHAALLFCENLHNRSKLWKTCFTREFENQHVAFFLFRGTKQANSFQRANTDLFHFLLKSGLIGKGFTVSLSGFHAQGSCW